MADARRTTDSVLGLLNVNEMAIYIESSEEINLYRAIAAEKNPLIREKEMNRHYSSMYSKLDEIRGLSNPALMLGIEYALLERDERNPLKITERLGTDRFLKADMTTNRKSREAVVGALEALKYQVKKSKQFHEVMNIGSSAYDPEKLPVDSVRKASRTQANVLQNEAKGLVQTDMELKRRTFLGKRHQNMVTCESVYKAIQREAKRIRNA